MLSANECDAWLTLAELGAMTRYPGASISAQLRHLKKPQFGNFELQKRARKHADADWSHGVVWEYRIGRRARVVRQRAWRKARAKRAVNSSAAVLWEANVTGQDALGEMSVC